MTDDQLQVSIEASDSSEAREVEALLVSYGAENVRTTGEGARGVVFIPIIVGAVIGVTALVDLYERWRKNTMCQEIIEVRKDGSTVIKRDCSIKDGRIIVISPEGMKVEIHDVPDGVDVNKIVEAALKSGADAVKAAAEAVGAKADGPSSAGPSS